MIATSAPRRLALAATLGLAALTHTTPAHAGPTLSADLDLGTSTTSAQNGTLTTVARPSLLYLVGFTLRAGWRFDVGPIFLLPEIGGGYAVERRQAPPLAMSPPAGHLGRLVAGGRVGWSGAVLPGLRLEPAVYGHVGAGWYGANGPGSFTYEGPGIYDPSRTGTAFDVGASLDLRILKILLVGAHLGYDVVTVWHPGNVVLVGSGGVASSTTATGPAVADGWVAYGVHAGVLFW